MKCAVSTYAGPDDVVVVGWYVCGEQLPSRVVPPCSKRLRPFPSWRSPRTLRHPCLVSTPRVGSPKHSSIRYLNKLLTHFCVNAIIATTGYAGFDPLGFSDYYDIKWMQEAETKHRGVCMLASLCMVCSHM